MGSAMGNAALTQRQGSRQSGDSVQVRINKMRNTDVGKTCCVLRLQKYSQKNSGWKNTGTDITN